MNEAIRNLVMLMWTVSAINTNAQAQSVTTYAIQEEAPSAPVLVFGAANRGNGRQDDFLVEQPNENNPLGNPIDVPYNQPFSSAPNASVAKTPAKASANTNIVTEDLPQNPEISPQESPQKVNQEIQDTLYESGGRIYDVQSYPESDIKTIEQPNLDKTITTYPAN